MTSKKNIFSGGTPGADVTPASSGGASGDAFDGIQLDAGSVVFSTDHTWRGTRSAKISGGTSGASSPYYVVSGKNVAMREYLWLDAATGTDTPILWMGAGSTQIARLQLISNGKVRLFTAAGVQVWPSSTSVPATGQWVRFEMRVVVGTATAAPYDGEIHAAYYLGDSTTPVEEFHQTAVNLGTAAVTLARFGKAASSSNSTPFWLAAVQSNDATTSFIGPVPTSPPTIAVTGQDTYIIEATSSSSGTPTYAIAQSSGPTLAPVELSPGRWRVTRSTTGDRVYDVSVTDAAGTASQAFTVPKQVATSTGPRIRRRRMQADGTLK